MNIIIGGDLVPTESNFDLFRSGNIEELIGHNLKSILEESQHRIFNLEAPLTDTSFPIQKQGPNLIAPIDTIAGIYGLNPTLLCLANNHILDQGEQGFNTTLHTLKRFNIPHVGVGNTIQTAYIPYVFESEGKKVGIYNCAEHEFTIATETAPGANPFDPLNSLDHIAELKTRCDYVIVIYHGGKECYRYPSPYLQKVCRRMVDKGADLVVCQHSHCIGCEEQYAHGTIIYGQGNFLFDHSSSDFWQTSLLIQIKDNFEISYLPIAKHDHVIRLAGVAESEEILNAFQKRSEEIQVAGTIEKNYNAFAESMLPQYVMAAKGLNKSFFFRAFNKLSGYRLQRYILNRYVERNYHIALENYIACEAHRELLLCGIDAQKNDEYKGISI